MNNYGFTFVKEEGVLFASNFFNPAHFSNYFKFKSADEGTDVPVILKMLDEIFLNNYQIKVVYSGFAGIMPLPDILKRINYYKQLWIDINDAFQKRETFDQTRKLLSLDKKYSWVKKWKMYLNSGHDMVNEEHDHNIKLFWNSVKKK
jgi:hypothetical protein